MLRYCSNQVVGKDYRKLHSTPSLCSCSDISSPGHCRILGMKERATADEQHELRGASLGVAAAFAGADPLERPQSVPTSSQKDAKRPAEKDDSDSDTAEEDIGFRLRELVNDEEQYRGSRREHWWYVAWVALN